jgi:plasmid maintenance system antidote protein VapI
MNIFEQLEKENNLNSIEMARRLKIGKGYYSMLRKGDRPVSKNVAAALKREFDIPMDVSLCLSVNGRLTTKLT